MIYVVGLFPKIYAVEHFRNTKPSGFNGHQLVLIKSLKNALEIFALYPPKLIYIKYTDILNMSNMNYICEICPRER